MKKNKKIILISIIVIVVIIGIVFLALKLKEKFDNKLIETDISYIEFNDLFAYDITKQYNINNMNLSIVATSRDKETRNFNVTLAGVEIIIRRPKLKLGKYKDYIILYSEGEKNSDSELLVYNKNGKKVHRVLSKEDDGSVLINVGYDRNLKYIKSLTTLPEYATTNTVLVDSLLEYCSEYDTNVELEYTLVEENNQFDLKLQNKTCVEKKSNKKEEANSMEGAYTYNTTYIDETGLEHNYNVELELSNDNTFWYSVCSDNCNVYSGTYKLGSVAIVLNTDTTYSEDMTCKKKSKSIFYKIVDNKLVNESGGTATNKITETLSYVDASELKDILLYKDLFADVKCEE
ncbi:MAG: hypothetical protein J6B98_03260 [Bacilli bacterium]|nr:hypothetical protein [Bacilli bacterium]